MVSNKPSILIVDDEKVVCSLLHKELSEQGYLCSTTLDGHDALTKLSAQDFDVALLDIKLPGMSGMEVLSKIRSANHNTIAIMITAVNDVGTAVEAIKMGAADYIVKPLDMGRVISSIDMLLDSKKELPERSDYQTPLYFHGEEADTPAMEEPRDRRMNAIARGVEARLDSLFGYSKIVTQETIDIAQQLATPEKEIQRWVDARSRLDSERHKIIEHLLNKLKRSPLAQKIMGMLVSYLCTPKPDKSQN